MICANDEHPWKAKFLISVTEEGISNLICDNDGHTLKASFPMKENVKTKK